MRSAKRKRTWLCTHCTESLNFNSVENVPGFEARAAFTVNSATVFTPVGRGCFAVKEDVDIVPIIIDDTLSYVLWVATTNCPITSSTL